MEIFLQQKSAVLNIFRSASGVFIFLIDARVLGPPLLFRVVRDQAALNTQSEQTQPCRLCSLTKGVIMQGARVQLALIDSLL